MQPIVGIPCDHQKVGKHPSHLCQAKYVEAVHGGAGALPLLIPALGEGLALDDLLARLDGLLFTGNPSNVQPRLYGQDLANPDSPEDPARDATTLPLIRRAIDLGVPLLAICRGIQELNVALGGTLHQEVHKIDGRDDHRESNTDPLEVQYGPKHRVLLTMGGVLHTLLGKAEIDVNSLHGQGLDRLADGLVVEAFAPDGQVEAVHLPDARAFTLGVQWHPEWQYASNPHSVALFRSFGAAVAARAEARRSGSPIAAE